MTVDERTVEVLKKLYGERFDDFAAAHSEQACAAFVHVGDAIRGALEDAAQVCDAAEEKWWQEYKTGRGAGRANPHVQGMADGAEKCAVAIRALKVPA